MQTKEQVIVSAALAVLTTLFAQAEAQASNCGTNAGPGGQTTTTCPSPSPSPAPVGDIKVGDSRATVGDVRATVGDVRATGGDATVQSGAVQSSNTANNTATNAGNNVTISNTQAKQATHMNVASAPGNLTGCVAQSGFSVTLSAVGAGALGTSFTTGAKMVDGCTQAEMDKSIVGYGIASNDPATIVLAIAVAGHTKTLDEVTEERMAKFGRRNVVQPTPAPAPQQGNIALNQHFYGERATGEAQARGVPQQAQFVCNYVDKKTGTVMKGEIITVQGQPVCKTGGDAAPALK